jgi:hypothetical protein
VKLLVIDAIRKTVSGVTALSAALFSVALLLSVTSRTPAAFTQTNSPSTTTPITAPGIRSPDALNNFSISGNAAASFCFLSGSLNAAGGTLPVATRLCACATGRVNNQI